MENSTPEWVRVPIGPESPRFNTVAFERTVLVVARTLTTTDWLLDVVDEVLADPRIQVLFTIEDEAPSVYHRGAAELLHRVGASLIPWSQAVSHPFDLAISSTFGGSLDKLTSPLLIGLHGAGLSKPGSLMPGARVAKPHVGSVARPATTVMLPCRHDLDRFDLSDARVRFEIVGDPCLDRLTASLPLRQRFRHQLGVAQHQRLVVLSSTWGRGALLGREPGVAERLALEAPIDTHRLALIVHPNIWMGHSEWQVRTWLRRAGDAGVLVVEPWRNAWRSVLISADLVVHDHGSVGLYAAALGIPTMTCHFSADLTMEPSAIRNLGRVAPSLDCSQPACEQFDAATANYNPAQRQAAVHWITDAPGEALGRHLDVIYDLLDLNPPSRDVRTLAVDEPTTALPSVRSTRVRVTRDRDAILVRRCPASAPPPPRHPRRLTAGVPHDGAQYDTHPECGDHRVLGQRSVPTGDPRQLPRMPVRANPRLRRDGTAAPPIRQPDRPIHSRP